MVCLTEDTVTSRTRLAHLNFSLTMSNSGPDFMNFAVPLMRYPVPVPIFPWISWLPSVMSTLLLFSIFFSVFFMPNAGMRMMFFSGKKRYEFHVFTTCASLSS